MARKPTVFGEPSKEAPIQFRSNVGTKIGFVITQGGTPFDFSGWTGRCAITNLAGLAYSPAQNPVVDLDNTDPLKAMAYVTITRAIANYFKGKVGMKYDVEIDNGASSICLAWGNVTVDIGSAAIP